MTYAVTFQQTESGMNYKAHQIPPPPETQNLTHATEPVWRLRCGTSAYSHFFLKEEDSNLRRNVSNHMPNQTLSHLRRTSPQRAFCFELVNWAAGPSILPYLEARRTARGEQAFCRSSIPWILSYQPQTKLRTEETSRLFDQITLLSK